MSIIDSRITSIGAGTYQKQTLTRRVPTVFIALGGSGKDVVMRIRKRFADADLTKDPGFAQFVFIDTDIQAFTPVDEKGESFAELAPNQNELVAVPINPAQFNKTFRDLNAKVNCDHLSWLKQEMEKITPQSVLHGAGTYRPMGRLAFYLNYTAIRGTIERQIEAALKFAAENPSTVEENRVEVVIVMSLAGGTGAGMFIDVSYLVQDILNLPNYRSLIGKSVTLVGFLPGVFEQQKSILERLQQNAFAAFMELEHYGTPRTGDELFLGDMRNGTRQSQNWTGFSANWGDGVKRFIRGPGWDTCFLIDNRNDLDPNSPLSPREVFQMAADYLFLDFENHQFAIAKRSARCNLVQFKDKIKETWVRRPDNTNVSNSIYEGNSVYATQNGCRFSSFGLAEIYFDVEKLYQIAAYRLAGLLVRGLWVGHADRFPESQYTTWVREHLLQPKAEADQKSPPSFHPESLTRQLLTVASGGSYLDDLKRDLEGLADLDPADGLGRLNALLKTHSGSLREGARGENGAARQTLQEKTKELSGDPHILGPLRNRLRHLAARHCARYGVAVTLNLLDKYREALKEIRKQALKQADATPPDDNALLARLAEAEKVPWPVHDTAMVIEFARARDEVARAMKLRYEKAAAQSIDNLLREVSRYIGAPDQQAYPDLAKHGTLYGHYTQAQTILRAIASRLERQFEVSFNDDLPDVDGANDAQSKSAGSQNLAPKFSRRHSISPKWDKATYDIRIVEAIVGHPAVTNSVKTASPVEKFDFDWHQFEALILKALQALPRGDLKAVKSVDDLVHYFMVNGYIVKGDVTPEGVNLVAELLAEVCKTVLHGEKNANGEWGGGFQLREEGGGNAIDLLVGDPKWAEILEKMVKASMPYFQTTDPARISSDFSPAYSNLYSQKQGTSVPSVNNANRVYQKVRDLVAAKAQYIPNQAAKALANPLPSENSTIILVREMTGFPLQFYAPLDTLRASYEKAITRVGNLGPDVAHINFNEASENLPDITLLETDTYALIRDHVSFVIRAIILGTINWQEDVLKVSVPDPFGPRGRQLRLGKRLHRAIKYACDTEQVRKHLVKVWNDWANQANARDWACLYASARMTWSQLNPERDVRQGEISAPLRNCYESLLGLASTKLNATDEGKRWLRALESDPFEEVPPDELRDVSTNVSFAGKLVRTCLRRLNSEIPIYQILHDKVSDVEPPQ